VDVNFSNTRALDTSLQFVLFKMSPAYIRSKQKLDLHSYCI
jgi:hypothetical protein